MKSVSFILYFGFEFIYTVIRYCTAYCIFYVSKNVDDFKIGYFVQILAADKQMIKQKMAQMIRTGIFMFKRFRTVEIALSHICISY